MSKFRASFSILSSWSKGYVQDAIDMYFKLERPKNKFMLDGIRYHKSWERYINKNKKLHPQLSSTNRPLIAPKTELKLEMDISPTLEFVGVIDCLDEPILYEFKSGSRVSSDYANGNQADLYSILLEHNGYQVDKAIYIHFDQYLKITDSAMVWITKERKERAMEWLLKYSKEMDNYLEVKGYYEKYKNIPPVETIKKAL